MTELETAVKLINDDDPAQQLIGVKHIRILLSAAVEANRTATFIPLVIASGVVQRLVLFLQADSPTIQFEAAWALTNVLADDPSATRAVVDAGAVPWLIALMRSPHESVRSQAVWAIGNIAGDCKEMRDMLLAIDDTVPALIDNLADLSQYELVSTASWTLSNVCRFQPPRSAVERVLPAITTLLKEPRGEVVNNAFWTIAFICDYSGTDDRIQAVIDTGALSNALRRIGSFKSRELSMPLVHCFSMFATNASPTQFVQLSHCDIVERLLQLADLHEEEPDLPTRTLTCLELIVRRVHKGTLNQMRSSGTAQKVVASFLNESAPASITALSNILFVLERIRMADICIALHALDLPALVTVHILEHVSESVASTSFHHKWAVATRVKHFQKRVDS
jgi:hypothetical protein